jgi:mono/diheme cytochrome c family protein
MRCRRGVVSSRAAVAAVALAIVIGGCGSSGKHRSSSGTGKATGSGAITLRRPGSGSGANVSGRALFAEHCAICHSISGNPYSRKDGGDLRGLQLSRVELVQFTAEMPAAGGRLTGAQVQAVVDFLQALALRR